MLVALLYNSKRDKRSWIEIFHHCTTRKKRAGIELVVLIRDRSENLNYCATRNKRAGIELVVTTRDKSEDRALINQCT